ncbi:MAG: enoyl-CoA hydratase/isomerase family protein [Hyphomicrobiaceae bacterium]
MTNETEVRDGKAAGVVFERDGALAIAKLERPDRLNAISGEMQAGLAAWLAPLARDPGVYAALMVSGLDRVFSVGGDVREILDHARRDVKATREALGRELALCWQYECFSKPAVSFIDGKVMGTGVGITLYGTHRIAAEGYRFSMPETAIGYFPDCGISHAFARMPHAIGPYLALTGTEAGAEDALALGLATHCIGRSELAAIRAALADADPVDPVLDSRHTPPRGPGPIIAAAARIERYFDAPFLSDIVGRLEKPHDPDREWAATTLKLIRSRSPLASCLTFRAIMSAARLDIRETLLQDFRLAWRLVEEPDFLTGAHAVLIEKSGRPAWRHARIEDVPAGLVEDYFAPLGADELALPVRSEMQAARG